MGDELKIAIVGGSPHGAKAPFEDPSWQIWAHGNQMNRWPADNVDVIFEIHDDLSEHGDVDQYVKYLLGFEKPMVIGEGMNLPSTWNPTRNPVRTFPFERARELLDGDHLSSTPAYMMALAILEEATEIGIWGVDMAVDDHEYFMQRPDMYAWIAYARAKGIKVTICEDSSLYKSTFVEGRQSKSELARPPFTEAEFRKMRDIHAQYMGQINDQIARLQAQYQTHDGCRQVYDRLSKVARAVESGQAVKSLSDTAVINQ